MNTLRSNATPLPLLALASGTVWAVPVAAGAVQAPAVPLPAEDEPPAASAVWLDLRR
jgi:hypothetical protein